MAHSFVEIMPERNDSTVMIVDSLNLAFRWKHRGSTDFRYEMEETIASLARSYNAGRIIVLCDIGSSSYRKEIYPEYKGNREELYKDQSEEDKAFFEEFFAEYKEALEVLKQRHEVYAYKGVEADDLAAHLVINKDLYGFEEVWLISSDRDWDLLVEENVHRFSYVTRKEYKVDNWDEHYTVPRENYICLKCLQGDKGDNVPGVPGVGPVRALSLIEQYGSIFDVADALPLSGSAKYIQNLNEFGYDKLMLNLELMDLRSFCDTAIGQENLEDLRERLHARNSD